MKHLTISEDAKIYTVTLDRPPVNAINTGLVNELYQAANKISSDENARVVLLTGNGKQFCAGADLKERKTMSEDEVREYIKKIRTCFYEWYSIPIPTICAMNGGTYGGGLELALMCDIRYIVHEAKLGLRETRLGIIPGAGGTQRLSRIAGESVALKWVMSGQVFTAQNALNDGVVDKVLPTADLTDEATNLAREFLRAAPIAVRQAKKAIREGLELPFKEALEFETGCYEKTIPTEDRREALRAFAEKRDPNWTGK
ncbi:MAG: enoyl-CoA hydratase/isomerase family protein [Candidatus Marinimicrobia bacterium]|nr:enoyl-CoA hydratase/isomerase family protein [Candidatus Neomarinimicrobiota bacterium]MCF7828183.1 enoyl-CoA hydratase/isomerase family protein [Candidatus Neomarinimicrobiota bacterium]MCF7879642.1 enoyl-CoA hydratase/isomerase family protein [Candidatus Neomarinimicrobiota bacterium]